MSAFLCSPQHIGQLVSFFRAHSQYSLPDGDEMAIELARANLASIDARYERPSDRIELRGDFTDGSYIEACVDRSHAMCRIGAVAALKMAQCLDYQSCEVLNWQLTGAATSIRHIQSLAMSLLPGYDRAPWEYVAA